MTIFESLIKQTKTKIMNAITITTEKELLVMIIGIAAFFIIGFVGAYLYNRSTSKA